MSQAVKAAVVVHQLNQMLVHLLAVVPVKLHPPAVVAMVELMMAALDLLVLAFLVVAQVQVPVLVANCSDGDSSSLFIPCCWSVWHVTKHVTAPCVSAAATYASSKKSI